jgi:hypothetical protein
VQSTPTIFVGKTGTKPKPVAMDATDTQALVDAIETALAG